MRYFIETICGGHNAAGGGCGGPLGVVEVSKDTFDSVKGRVNYDDFFEHSISETGLTIREGESFRVRLQFRACNSCRIRV